MIEKLIDLVCNELNKGTTDEELKEIFRLTDRELKLFQWGNLQKNKVEELTGEMQNELNELTKSIHFQSGNIERIQKQYGKLKKSKERIPFLENNKGVYTISEIAEKFGITYIGCYNFLKKHNMLDCAKTKNMNRNINKQETETNFSKVKDEIFKFTNEN